MLKYLLKSIFGVISETVFHRVGLEPSLLPLCNDLMLSSYILMFFTFSFYAEKIPHGTSFKQQISS